MPEEAKVAVERKADGATPAEGGKKKGDDVLKPVPKPDEDELKQKIEVANEKVNALQERLEAIKKNLDAREGGRGDSPEIAVAKAKLNEAKAKSRMLQQEKRNIYDQISAADELKKQQQDLTARLKAQLSLFSVDEIDRRIKALEHLQQTTSISVKEDKKIMEELKKLSLSKPMIRQYDEAQESLKGVRDHHTTLYTQLKAKNADLTIVREDEDRCKGGLDAIKAKDEAKRADIPALWKERETIRKDVIDLRETIRKLRDDFNDRRKEWQNFVRIQRDQKAKEWAEQKAKRQAEYDAEKKAYEEEQAKRDPWEEEKLICEQLIGFVNKYLPKAAEAKVEAKAVEHPDGQKPLTKSSLDDDDPYANLVKKKSKRKGGAPKEAGVGAGTPSIGGAGGAAVAAVKPKSMRLSHSVEDFALWDKLGFKAPATTEDCAALHEQLLAKREWLKTAPPKPKKAALVPSDAAGAKAGAKAGDADAKGKGSSPKPEMITVKAHSDSSVTVRLHFG